MSLLLLLLHVYVYHPTIIYTYSITYHWISRKCNITKIENIKEKKQKNSRTRNSDEFIPLFYLQPRPLACHTHKIDRNTKKMFERKQNSRSSSFLFEIAGSRHSKTWTRYDEVKDAQPLFFFSFSESILSWEEICRVDQWGWTINRIVTILKGDEGEGGDRWSRLDSTERVAALGSKSWPFSCTWPWH